MLLSENVSGAPSQENPAARDVRNALWRVYRAAMRRYASPDGILARSIERTADGWVVHEPCPLNTAEMLKAAFLMESKGVAHPFDTRALMDRMMAAHVANADHQVVALMLWAAAIGDRRHTAALWTLLGNKVPRDASQSMALAWVLCALCEYAGASRERDEVAAFAREIFGRLVQNQDAASGLFYPSARREGWLRRRVADTTLSSQTYPILALASYARCFGVTEALGAAERCADRLCALQGAQGQWWWRYQARQGTVGDRYPVYCVNQDSAIPAALGQLQRGLGDTHYDAAIARGLRWEGGDNEARVSMLDEPSGFVARSLDVTRDGVQCSWEMHAYQPARFVYTVLSNPEWAAEVAP